jgi:hypothetical protein
MKNYHFMAFKEAEADLFIGKPKHVAGLNFEKLEL